MPTVTVGVYWDAEGLASAVQALTDAGDPDNVSGAVRDGLAEAGGIVVDAAQALAPVATGFMRDSIHTVDSPDAVEVVADAEYAYTFHAIAMGISHGGFSFVYGPRPGRRGYVRRSYIPDEPFMFDAWDNTQDDVTNAVFDSLSMMWEALGNG